MLQALIPRFAQGPPRLDLDVFGSPDPDRSPFTSRRESNLRHCITGLSYDDSFIPLGYRSTHVIKLFCTVTWVRFPPTG